MVCKLLSFLNIFLAYEVYIKRQKSISAGLHIPAETGRNGRNRPKQPKQAEILAEVEHGVPRTGLHAGTRFSVRSGRNGTEYTTLIILS